MQLVEEARDKHRQGKGCGSLVVEGGVAVQDLKVESYADLKILQQNASRAIQWLRENWSRSPRWHPFAAAVPNCQKTGASVVMQTFVEAALN
jgi:hypothetical protein